MDVDKLSDAELRTKLLEFGFPVMPITGTTRKVMAKKLKMLLENKNKIGSDGTRRSLGRYSSEEDSDSEVKVSKKENRRITMATPLMQPPSVGVKVRKSTRFNETPELENNVGIELSRNPVKHESRTTTTTTTKTQKIIKSAQDEFDTGSESESDIVNNYNLIKGTSDYSKNIPETAPNTSSVRYSPPKSTDTSYGSTRNVSFNFNSSPSRVSTYNSPSLASEYASDKLNQIRSRLSLNKPSYESPVYSSSLPAKEETPFLSNFTKRLSALSHQKNDQDYKKDIKEHDTNGSSTFVRSQLSSFRATRGRDTTYDYKVNQNKILKSNFVSFAVLAGAALFFVVLAILYMGMRSDTSSLISPDYVIPYCIPNDINFKKGVNCIFENDVTTALELLMALKPELQKRAIANKCFDKTLKPHMTSSEIVNFCVSNYAIQDPLQIRADLHNLEILTFNNPDWGIKVAQTDNNNGLITEDDVAKDMEQVIFHENDKITSLVILNPGLPWKCTIYKTFNLAINSIVLVLFIFVTLYLLNYSYKYYKHHEQKQKDEIGFMVERIIDILQSSCGEEGGDPFLVINHVRDMILPVVDRQKKGKTWIKAVQFINENESRVRTEIQEVKGESFEVWRWIGSANISMGGDRSDYIYRHGRRIVDAQYLITEVLKFPHNRFRFCRNSDVTIKNEIREGLLSVLVLQCQTCKREHSVCSEDPDSELMNVNLALVAGIVSLGLGLYHLNELCSSLHIPTVSGDEYSQYLDEIYDIYNDSITGSEKSSESTFEKRILRSSTPKKREAEDDYDQKKNQFLNELKKSPNEIETLSNMTINQRESPLWYQERKKRITASNFGRICKLLDSTDRKKVVEELLYSTFRGNIYTRYGIDNEVNAMRDFEKLFGQKVISCGLFIHKNYPFLAASPDGLLGEDAIIEIKCPYKARNVSPEDGIRQKLIMFANIENGIFTLKKTDKYYYQVQGQLFVTGRDICYFIIWTPHGLVYEKIVRDEELWNKMFPKLEEFYFTHLLPALLKDQLKN